MDEPQTDPVMERGGNMSFLEHLDELRKRLVNIAVIVVIAFVFSWFLSDIIFDFLSVPIRRALSQAQQSDAPIIGVDGTPTLIPLKDLQPGNRGIYVFDRTMRFGTAAVQAGTSVSVTVQHDADGKAWLFTDEAIISSSEVIPSGVRVPIDLAAEIEAGTGAERLIVTTAPEQFTLYVTVSMYAAIALSIPLILLQIWGFISPALYKHERAYVTPFVLLSSLSFIAGAAFAYYVLFPPAMNYLLGLGGGDFQLLLKATDYFDFITLIMLAMGLIFQMPAITYVLARIGIVSAEFLIKSWKIAIVVILIIAAVVSPTGDIPNLMLFALPMMFLYVISIGIAWFFGRKRITPDDV
jgi:sec-independent protein translocase protein TatC